MKKISKTCTGLLVLIAIVFYMTKVNAYSAIATLSSTSKLKAGDTVVVNINLKDIDAGEGLNGFVATLDYDENIFETIEQNNITAQNSWTMVGYSTKTKKFTMTKGSKLTKEETIATISFKVKSDITAQDTTVKLKNIEVSGGAEVDGGIGDLKVDDTTIVLKTDNTSIETDKDVDKNQNQNKNEMTTPTNTDKNNKITNKTTVNSTSTDNTTKINKLPKTGSGQFVSIVIIIAAITGIFSYVLYKRISTIVK